MTPKSTEKTGNPSNPASPGRRRRAGPLSRWRQVRFLDVFFATLPLVAIAVFVFGAACLDYQRISQYDDWWSNATSVRKFGWYRVRAALRQPRASVLRAEIAPEDPERATVRLRVDRAEFDELSSDVAGSWGQWIDATISTPSRELAAELRFRGDGSAHWTSEKKSLSIKTGKDELYRGFRRLNFTLKDVLPQYVVNSLAQDFDLLAPETHVLPVFVNEHYYGIFRFVEDVDESFLRRNMRMPGNVYRADAAERGEYLKGLPREVFLNPATWERVASNDRPGAPTEWGIHLLMEDLLGGTLESHARMMERVDRAELSRLLALMLLAGDPYHMSGVHNQLWYDDPVTGKLHPIVWDLRLLELGSPPRGSNWNRFWREVLRDPRVMADALAYLDANLDRVLETARERATSAWETYRPHFEYDRLREGVIHPVGDPESTLARLERNAERLRGWIEDARVDWALTEEGGEWFLDVWSRGHAPARLTAFDNVPLGMGSPALFVSRMGAGAPGPRQEQTPCLVDFDSGKAAGLSHPELLSPGLHVEGSELSPAPSRTRFVLTASGGAPPAELEPRFENAVTGAAVTGQRATGESLVGDATSWSVAALEDLEQVGGETVTLSGDVQLDEDLVVERGDFLVIAAGTKLTLAPDVSILVKGHVRAASSPEDPIVVTSASPELPFGTFALQGPGTEGSYFNNVRFERGGGMLLDRVEYKGAVNVYASPGVTFENCVFADNLRCDDLLNVVKSHVDLSDCRFEGANADSIDYDMSTGTIARCEVVGSGNDGLDLMTCSPRVIDTRIVGSGDKGISIGEAATPRVLRTTIEDCVVGVELKDLSEPVFTNTPISGCGTGVLARRKNWRYAGAGRGVFIDTDVSGNGVDLELLDGASIVETTLEQVPVLAELDFGAPFAAPELGWKRVGGARRVEAVDGDLVVDFRDFEGAVVRAVDWGYGALRDTAMLDVIAAADAGVEATLGVRVGDRTLEVPLVLGAGPDRFGLTRVVLPHDTAKAVQALALSVDPGPEGARLRVRAIRLTVLPHGTF